MAQAPYCDDADALIDVARTAASRFQPPMADNEVVKTALSAWKYETEGRNWIGRGRQRPEPSTPDGLIWENPDAFLLLMVLNQYNGGRAQFLVANEMAGLMPGGGWTRLAAARKALLGHGHITLLQAARTGSPAVYTWGLPVAAASPVALPFERIGELHSERTPADRAPHIG